MFESRSRIFKQGSHSLAESRIYHSIPYSGKRNVRSSASELHTPLTMATILSKYPDVFDDSVGKLEGELHLYTKQDVTPSKAAPRRSP